MFEKELITESEVITETLVDLFEQAFYKTSVDSDGDILVNVDDYKVFVILDKDRKFLKYMALHAVKESASPESKLALVNRLNDEYIFCRFSIHGQNSDQLIADYFLSFEKEVTGYQIIRSLRLFARLVPDSINDCDKDDLIG